MSFIWPQMLYFMLLIPLFVGLYYLMLQRRRRIIANYGRFGFLQQESGHGLGGRRHVPPTLFLLSLTALTLSLARPQTVVSLPRVEGNVILVFDISGSMAAEDIQPTRLEAAKAAAREFAQRQPPSVQIGIVAFSEGGLGVLAPTNDQTAILSAIDRLSPQRGTSLANGIISAMETIVGPAEELAVPVDPQAMPDPQIPVTGDQDYSSSVIVLLTDGENNMTPDPLEVAETAADYGIRIHTIGIGSAAGVDLEVNGFIVHTQLDETTLQQVAALTGGTYFNAQNEDDLRTIYENIQPQMVIKKEDMEVTSIFAGVGILVLLLGGAFSLLWFNRMP